MNKLVRSLITILLLGFIMTVLTQTSSTNIQTIKTLANEYFGTNTVLADLTVCQAILESRLNGLPSQLASKYNNLFGIKWPELAEHVLVAKQYGSPVYLSTQEEYHGKMITIKAPFIAFKSLEDCLQYRKYMLSWSIYSNVQQATSLQDAATKLQQDHYATDSNYAQELQKIYQEYVK